MYGFKMDLFGNVKPEELLLFVWNYNMTLEASGLLTKNTKIITCVIDYLESIYVNPKQYFSILEAQLLHI